MPAVVAVVLHVVPELPYSTGTGMSVFSVTASVLGTETQTGVAKDLHSVCVLPTRQSA